GVPARADERGGNRRGGRLRDRGGGSRRPCGYGPGHEPAEVPLQRTDGFRPRFREGARPSHLECHASGSFRLFTASPKRFIRWFLRNVPSAMRFHCARNFFIARAVLAPGGPVRYHPPSASPLPFRPDSDPMRFSDSFLDEIRARLPISAVIAPRVTWDRRKTNASRGDWWACCPFHGESTPSFHCEDHKG